MTVRATIAAVMLLLGACSSGSEDAGRSTARSQVGTPATISHIHGVAVDAQGALYVATHHGLIRQAGDGSFVYASEDTTDHMGFSLHPGDRVMYRSGHSMAKPSLGVQRSTDGARWTHLADIAAPPVDFHAMTVSFADSATLWGSDSAGRGTFRSTDGGKTWTRLESRGIEPRIYVLAGTAENGVILAGTASGLYRSRDGGATWQRVIGGGWVIGAAASPSDAKHALASTQQGIKVTRDAGATWTATGAGIPPGAEIANLAISPADAKVAYAADSSTIYKTEDGAKSWVKIYPA